MLLLVFDLAAVVGALTVAVEIVVSICCCSFWCCCCTGKTGISWHSVGIVIIDVNVVVEDGTVVVVVKCVHVDRCTDKKSTFRY